MSWPDVADPCHSTEEVYTQLYRIRRDDWDEKADPTGQIWLAVKKIIISLFSFSIDGIRFDQA